MDICRKSLHPATRTCADRIDLSSGYCTSAMSLSELKRLTIESCKSSTLCERACEQLESDLRDAARQRHDRNEAEMEHVTAPLAGRPVEASGAFSSCRASWASRLARGLDIDYGGRLTSSNQLRTVLLWQETGLKWWLGSRVRRGSDGKVFFDVRPLPSRFPLHHPARLAAGCEGRFRTPSANSYTRRYPRSAFPLDSRFG